MVLSFRSIYEIIRQAYFCGSPTWNPRDIPDLTGKVIIVTGGNAGLGKETIQHLMRHNAKVYVASRDEAKVRETIKELYQTTGKEAIFLHLDLADLKSVKKAAEEFTSKEKKLHILFNNAGVLMAFRQEQTVSGHDLQFGTNVLGHFYFTKLLLPTLLETGRSSSEPVRIVNLSSSAIYMMMGSFDFGTLKGKRRVVDPIFLYCQSKLGNVLFSNELARRYGDRNIISIAVNPGNIQTNLKTNLNTLFKFLIELLQLYPPEWGALTQLYAGCDPDAAKMSGKFLILWARLGTPTPEAMDECLAKDLWEWMEEQVANVA